MVEAKRLTGEELKQAFKEELGYLAGLAESHRGEKIPVLNSDMVLDISNLSERGLTRIHISLISPKRIEEYMIDSTRGLRSFNAREKVMVRSTILGELPYPPESIVGADFVDVGSRRYEVPWKPGTPEYDKFIKDGKLMALAIADWVKKNT